MERSRLSDAPLVLLVDDQPSNLIMLQQMVRWAGYRTCEATNGYQALELLQREQPDVVVLDIFMPDVDGFTILRTIRSQLTTYIPVIMITAQEESRARQQAYHEGADDFLMKPIDSETLRARLRVAIHLKRTLSRVELERERFAFIASLSRELTQIGALPAMLEHIVDVCGQTLDAAHTNIVVLRKGSRIVDRLVSSTANSVALDDLVQVLDQGAARHVLDTGRSLVIDDVNASPLWLPLETSIIQSGAALIVPLTDSEGVLGLLELYHNTSGYFTPDDQEAIELVARQVAGLIRQTQLREEQALLSDQLALQTRQLRLVNSLAHTLTANLDLPMLYRTINAQMKLLLGSVTTGWFRFHGEQIELAYASTSAQMVRPDALVRAISRINNLERAQRFTLEQFNDISELDPLRDHGFHGCITVPLHHQGRTLGILVVIVQGREFTIEEESLLDMARPHLAVALAAAQMIAERESRQTEIAELVHLRNMAELAGQMAHHFNNLFAAIMGNTQLAELDAVNDDQRELLATVVDQVRDGAQMIKRLHLLKGGIRQPAPYPIDLAESLPVVLEHLEQSINLPPEIRGDLQGPLFVPLHERELMTLCSELLSNALESGSAIEDIRLTAYTTPHHTILEISDRGQGIVPAEITSVWRPFWTTHGPQRLGLGLPICSAVMWRLGGRISLQPNPTGQGITVALQFPRVEEDSNA